MGPEAHMNSFFNIFKILREYSRLQPQEVISKTRQKPNAFVAPLKAGLSNLIQIFEMASGKILPIIISEFEEIFKFPNLYLVSK
jgi:hypothetical protein